MLKNPLTISSLIVAVVSISIAVLIATRYRSIVRRRMRMWEREYYLWRTSQTEERLKRSDVKSKRLEEIVKEKKRKFLDIPSISFHFANKEQVKNFYNDYFKEPTLKSLVSEITEEASGEVKGSLPKLLESRIGSRDLTKWISELKLPDTTLGGMFLRYQRETIKNEQVSLGIEEVEIELNELQEFEDSIGDLEKRFGLKLEESLLNDHRGSLKQKAAEKTLVKLEQATGWVLIEGRFRILSQDEFYNCVYDHPVNEYLPTDVGPITISVLVRADSLEPQFAGNYAQSVDKLVPLKIYGKVWQPIDRKTNAWDLQLTPLAIY